MYDMMGEVQHNLQVIECMIRGKHKKLENITDKRLSATNNIVKTPSLLEHTNKIEQKLSYLKQKILQKKKISLQQKKPIADEALLTFITKIGLNEYMNALIDNGIDSFDILKEAKQSQLQEIGILKGHALKIIVHIKKQEERSRKKSLNQISKQNIGTNEMSKQRQQTKPTLSQSSIHQKPVVCQVDSMQTQGFPISSIKKSFCLYCFTRSQFNFCSPNCEQLYNSMFSKYECNLQKAEDSFIPKQLPKVEEELSDNQQFLQNFDFLFNPQQQNFDIEQYESIKDIIKK